MNNTLVRPKHLPDFKNPPLHEVVVGVQFSIPNGYQPIMAGNVWDLFRDNYPDVQEVQALAPSFETFGVSRQHSNAPQIGFITGGIHNRYWFLNKNGSKLIQFQQDRLLHNWRKVESDGEEYPRFESMITEFQFELEKLEGYIASIQPQKLLINQCEVSYINHIKLGSDEHKHLSDWFNFLSFTLKPSDDFNANFREVIRDADDKPLGRLLIDAALGFLPSGEEIIALSLSVRGAPTNTDIKTAVDFLKNGRELIGIKFAELTSEKAHLEWGRIK